MGLVVVRRSSLRNLNWNPPLHWILCALVETEVSKPHIERGKGPYRQCLWSVFPA